MGPGREPWHRTTPGGTSFWSVCSLGSLWWHMAVSQWVVTVSFLPEGQPAHSPHPKKETLPGPETPRLWTAWDFTEPCGWHDLLQGIWPQAEAEAAEASGYSSVPSTPVQPAGHWEVQGRVTWGWMGGGWEGACGSSPRSPPF